ncbi:uncharacterized protein LOC127843933 isoform X2 [Dreissena polymorpha]|uniref:uncharacterized protein LOC127843933 isoform X2 n=1 Tax=Dreissena polymorpha TaxID=45954 RepID=UPI0022648165|nr:uncharacterized protein LOC127843933 isoform X2 [Dreissena polymorpha]
MSNTTPKHQESRRTSTRGVSNDIYLLYDELDTNLVMPFAEHFRPFYTVFDPHTDGAQNEPEHRSWLDRGIYRSKMTVVFLSKQSQKNSECEFQLAHAIKSLTKTKYMHRIVVVMVEFCKIPKNLGHFKIVYAFQNDVFERNVHQLREAIKIAPRETFTRLDVSWKNHPNVLQTVVGTPKLQPLTQEIPIKISLLDIIRNPRKVIDVLNNFYVRCNKQGCSFRCRGENLKEAHEHIRSCKYELVQCRYCKQSVSRKNIMKHELRKCRRRSVTCPNKGCAFLGCYADHESHNTSCEYRMQKCLNNCYGCKSVYPLKDIIKHTQVCDYEKCICTVCSKELFKIDLERHNCTNTCEHEAESKSLNTVLMLKSYNFEPTRLCEVHDKASPCSSDLLEQTMAKPEKESSKVASTSRHLLRFCHNAACDANKTVKTCVPQIPIMNSVPDATCSVKSIGDDDNCRMISSDTTDQTTKIDGEK